MFLAPQRIYIQESDNLRKVLIDHFGRNMFAVLNLCEDDSAHFSSHISHIRRKLQTVLNPVDVERFCIKRHAGGIYRIGALKR